MAGKKKASAKAHGSVFNTITRDTFKTINSCFGGVVLSHKFDAAVRPLLDRILANCRESTVLENSRDTLLPKLLSGQLTIPDAEKLAADVL